ncbi:VOC family protein, partial [Frankia sp. Cpl3]|nr:VOC family protein [Frankia sp. Cpl3]
MNGRGPRLHHIGFWLPDPLSLIHACDVLASMGYGHVIERGPGRHGLSNAFFLYLRDPDGHRIELYNGDYLTGDPDFTPIRWDLNDPRRQTFWGHKAP